MGSLIGGGGLPARRDAFEDNVQDAAEFEGYCFIDDEYMKLPALPRSSLTGWKTSLKGYIIFI